MTGADKGSGASAPSSTWTPEEQARADRYQRQSAALYRALRAALRREPTPRERFRAQQAFETQMGEQG